MQDHLVVALVYDRLCTFEFGCVTELFALERPELELDWYRFAACAVEPGPLRAAGGITVAAPYSLRLLDRAASKAPRRLSCLAGAMPMNYPLRLC
jgi:AraC family transcriptional activator FtrA